MNKALINHYKLSYIISKLTLHGNQILGYNFGAEQLGDEHLLVYLSSILGEYNGQFLQR